MIRIIEEHLLAMLVQHYDIAYDAGIFADCCHVRHWWWLLKRYMRKQSRWATDLLGPTFKTLAFWSLPEAGQSGHACGGDNDILQSCTYLDSLIKRVGSHQEGFQRVCLTQGAMVDSPNKSTCCRYLYRRTEIWIFMMLISKDLLYGRDVDTKQWCEEHSDAFSTELQAVTEGTVASQWQLCNAQLRCIYYLCGPWWPTPSKCKNIFLCMSLRKVTSDMFHRTPHKVGKPDLGFYSLLLSFQYHSCSSLSLCPPYPHLTFHTLSHTLHYWVHMCSEPHDEKEWRVWIFWRG